MTGALLSFSTVAVAIKSLASTFGLFDILAFRSATGLAALLVALGAVPALRRSVSVRHAGLHLARNGVHFAGQYLWSVGVVLLPLATVFALEFTTPAWVAAMAVLFLGERMTAGRLGAIAFGLVGIVVILRPGLETLRPGALAVLGSAVAFAATAIGTKLLTRREGTFAILLWMNALQLPVTLAGSDPASWGRVGAEHWPALAALAVAGLTSHLCLTQAYRHGDATVVVPLDFLRLPLIAVVGFLAFGEALDPWVFVGAAFIIVGTMWSLLSETRGKSARRARE
jgi:drug/metabolite transporter (DMT)-like permease